MTTGYSSGLRRDRITILNRAQETVGRFGIDSDGVQWQTGPTVWASVTWTKGMRALNQGAIDCYGIVMVRLNYTTAISARSRIIYDNDTYRVLPETFHADRRQNTIQFNAQLIIDDD